MRAEGKLQSMRACLRMPRTNGLEALTQEKTGGMEPGEDAGPAKRTASVGKRRQNKRVAMVRRENGPLRENEERRRIPGPFLQRGTAAGRSGRRLLGCSFSAGLCAAGTAVAFLPAQTQAFWRLSFGCALFCLKCAGMPQRFAHGCLYQTRARGLRGAADWQCPFCASARGRKPNKKSRPKGWLAVCRKTSGEVSEGPQSLRLSLVSAGFAGGASCSFCLQNQFLSTPEGRWLAEAAFITFSAR